MQTMAAEAVGRMDEFLEQNFSNMAWAFAKLRHLDQELMDAIAGKRRAATISRDIERQIA